MPDAARVLGIEPHCTHRWDCSLTLISRGLFRSHTSHIPQISKDTLLCLEFCSDCFNSSPQDNIELCHPPLLRNADHVDLPRDSRSRCLRMVCLNGLLWIN